VFARWNVTPTLERALRKVLDDWIEWDGNAGFIDDIGFRGTRVRTFNNETVTVPNTELATIPVTNRMSNETLRIAYSFGVGYGDDLSGELTVHEPPHS
jgi:small-conductance mechanosensitive channel